MAMRMFAEGVVGRGMIRKALKATVQSDWKTVVTAWYYVFLVLVSGVSTATIGTVIKSLENAPITLPLAGATAATMLLRIHYREFVEWLLGPTQLAKDLRTAIVAIVDLAETVLNLLIQLGKVGLDVYDLVLPIFHYLVKIFFGIGAPGAVVVSEPQSQTMQTAMLVTQTLKGTYYVNGIKERVTINVKVNPNRPLRDQLLELDPDEIYMHSFSFNSTYTGENIIDTYLGQIEGQLQCIAMALGQGFVGIMRELLVTFSSILTAVIDQFEASGGFDNFGSLGDADESILLDNGHRFRVRRAGTLDATGAPLFRDSSFTNFCAPVGGLITMVVKMVNTVIRMIGQLARGFVPIFVSLFHVVFGFLVQIMPFLLQTLTMILNMFAPGSPIGDFLMGAVQFLSGMIEGFFTSCAGRLIMDMMTCFITVLVLGFIWIIIVIINGIIFVFTFFTHPNTIPVPDMTAVTTACSAMLQPCPAQNNGTTAHNGTATHELGVSLCTPSTCMSVLAVNATTQALYDSTLDEQVLYTSCVTALPGEVDSPHMRQACDQYVSAVTANWEEGPQYGVEAFCASASQQLFGCKSAMPHCLGSVCADFATYFVDGYISQHASTYHCGNFTNTQLGFGVACPAWAFRVLEKPGSVAAVPISLCNALKSATLDVCASFSTTTPLTDIQAVIANRLCDYTRTSLVCVNTRPNAPSPRLQHLYSCAAKGAYKVHEFTAFNMTSFDPNCYDNHPVAVASINDLAHMGSLRRSKRSNSGILKATYVLSVNNLANLAWGHQIELAYRSAKVGISGTDNTTSTEYDTDPASHPGNTASPAQLPTQCSQFEAAYNSTSAPLTSSNANGYACMGGVAEVQNSQTAVQATSGTFVANNIGASTVVLDQVAREQLPGWNATTSHPAVIDAFSKIKASIPDIDQDALSQIQASAAVNMTGVYACGSEYDPVTNQPIPVGDGKQCVVDNTPVGLQEALSGDYLRSSHDPQRPLSMIVQSVTTQFSRAKNLFTETAKEIALQTMQGGSPGVKPFELTDRHIELLRSYLPRRPDPTALTVSKTAALQYKNVATAMIAFHKLLLEFGATSGNASNTCVNDISHPYQCCTDTATPFECCKGLWGCIPNFLENVQLPLMENLDFLNYTFCPEFQSYFYEMLWVPRVIFHNTVFWMINGTTYPDAKAVRNFVFGWLMFPTLNNQPIQVYWLSWVCWVLNSGLIWLTILVVFLLIIWVEEFAVPFSVALEMIDTFSMGAAVRHDGLVKVIKQSRVGSLVNLDRKLVSKDNRPGDMNAQSKKHENSILQRWRG